MASPAVRGSEVRVSAQGGECTTEANALCVCDTRCYNRGCVQADSGQCRVSVSVSSFGINRPLPTDGTLRWVWGISSGHVSSLAQCAPDGRNLRGVPARDHGAVGDFGLLVAGWHGALHWELADSLFVSLQRSGCACIRLRPSVLSGLDAVDHRPTKQ